MGAQMLEAPITEGIFCSKTGTFLCCWNECQLPPHPGNPKLACCGKKMNSDHSAASDKLAHRDRCLCIGFWLGFLSYMAGRCVQQDNQSLGQHTARADVAHVVGS